MKDKQENPVNPENQEHLGDGHNSSVDRQSSQEGAELEKEENKVLKPKSEAMSNQEDFDQHNFGGVDLPESQDVSGDASATVAMVVGKWAMPTTVLLVLITCVSGYYLEEAKFTPVVGMIAPVVMALIMVIREASVGKDTDTTLLNAESERKERMNQYLHDKDVRLAQLLSDEKIKSRELEEQARQFDMFHQSTREVLKLVRDTNNRVASQIEKPQSTELSVGETKIKIGTQGTEVVTDDAARTIE